jgi:hypothetical protein
MAMLFADESGDWNDQDFIALAGLTSSEAGWEALCQEWPILLQKHEIPVVHMKEIMPERGKSPAASWKMDKKLAMIEEFIGVIKKYMQYGFGIALDAKYYREQVSIVEKAAKEMGIKTKPFQPQIFCVARLLRRFIDHLKESRIYAQRADGRNPFSLIFDENEAYAMKCYSFICKLRHRDSFIKESIASVSFANDYFFYPLQAADILAYATQNELRKGDKAWDESNVYTRFFDEVDPAYGNRYYSEAWGEQDSEALTKAMVAEMVTQEQNSPKKPREIIIPVL